MKKAALSQLLILLFAGVATAGETGVINQAGPYEATMKFYLHPAHGFPGAAATTPPPGAFARGNANTTESGKTASQSPKTVAARSGSQPMKTHLSARLQFDP